MKKKTIMNRLIPAGDNIIISRSRKVGGGTAAAAVIITTATATTKRKRNKMSSKKVRYSMYILMTLKLLLLVSVFFFTTSTTMRMVSLSSSRTTTTATINNNVSTSLLSLTEQHPGVLLRKAVISSKTTAVEQKKEEEEQQQPAHDYDFEIVIAQQPQQQQQQETDNVASSPLANDIVLRVQLRKKECPNAYQMIQKLLLNQSTGDNRGVNDGHDNNNINNDICSKSNNYCHFYRGEPVPSTWGSKDLPDAWFNGGRWGPPYALIQGTFDGENNGGGSEIKNKALLLPDKKSKDARPIVQRGDIAWAGGKSINNDFFIALANHPEWKHGHTVFARLPFKEDTDALENLVNLSKRTIKIGNPSEHKPDVQNFEKKVRFRLRQRAPTHSSSLRVAGK